MRTFGNILWHFPFCGFLTAIATWLIGLILTITVVGAPVGRGLMEHGKFLFSPFKLAMVSGDELGKKQNPVWRVFSIIIQIIYFPFGLVLAALTLIQVALLFISITGIPVAIVLAKSLGTYFSPVNKKCVPHAVVEELERRKGQAEIQKHLAAG